MIPTLLTSTIVAWEENYYNLTKLKK